MRYIRGRRHSMGKSGIVIDARIKYYSGDAHSLTGGWRLL